MNPVFSRSFLCTPEISGEFRVTVMLSRGRLAAGIKPCRIGVETWRGLGTK
jgi:hypothetical protein